MALTSRQSERKEWLEGVLSDIEEALSGGIKNGVSGAFNGRSVQRYTPDELTKLQKRYDSELRRLERIEAGTNSRTIRVIG